MKIPTPDLQRLPYDLHGLNSIQQILYKWQHPPQYRLCSDFVIGMDDGLELIAPRGFVIDGASVPRLLWPIISPTGPLLEGAVFHDFFYQYGYLLARRDTLPCPPNLQSLAMSQTHRLLFTEYAPVFIGEDQRWGDQLLKQITIEKHGATVDAGRAYLALRLFGRFAFNKYRNMGPAAHGVNSLGLPGLGYEGVQF